MTDTRRRPADTGVIDDLPLSLDGVELGLDSARDAGAHDGRDLLKRQAQLIGWQVAGQRASFALKVLTAFAGIMAAGALLVMAWQASRAEGVILEPISVPPDLVETGLTAEALATQLLDKLAALQARTESARAANTYAHNGDGDIAVIIPSTGISIGELQSFLTRWLGHETRITGELVRTPAGLVLTSRVAGQGATRSEPGRVEDLDAMLQAAAEGIYRQTQPYRYSVFLRQTGRRDEAIALRRELAGDIDENERVWGLIGLGTLAATPDEALDYYDRVLELRPGFGLAYYNMGVQMSALGHDQAAVDHFQQALDRKRSLLRELQPGRSESLILGIQDALLRRLGDPAARVPLLEQIARLPADPGQAAAAELNTATALAQTYDLTGARDILQEAGLSDPAALAALVDDTSSDAVDPAWVFPALMDDWATAALRLQEVVDTYEPGSVLTGLSENTPTYYKPWLARSLARQGRLREARLAIAGTSADCYLCVTVRGEIDAAAGDVTRSEYWFAEAVRQAPRLPGAYVEWGSARLRRGDGQGSLIAFREAADLAPRMPEAWKGVGDAHLALGQLRDAIRAYERAAEITPRWGGLHLAWGRALAAAGRAREASQVVMRAAELDLSVADAAAVACLSSPTRCPPSRQGR